MVRSVHVGVGSTRCTFPGRIAEAAVELGRDDPLYDLVDAFTHQSDHEVDHPPFVAAVVAPLHPGDLVLDSALHPLAHQPHDGVDEALFIEFAAAAFSPAVGALVVVAITAVVSIAIAMAAVVVPISAAAGPRPGGVLEAFQPFENFTKIVVPHPSLLMPRTLVDAWGASTFAPTGPGLGGRGLLANAARPVLADVYAAGATHCLTTLG